METAVKQKVLAPALRFAEFEGNWETKKIGILFNISAGGDINQKHVSKIKTDVFCYPVFANADAGKGLYGYSDLFRIEPPVLTVAGRGVNIGVTHARYERFYPIVRLLVLKPKNKDSVKFFEYAINGVRLFLESTGVPQLTAPQIAGYNVHFPTLQEQEKIAGFLSAVDKKIAALQQKKEALTLYKKGVMQKLFSQEIRFKQANDNPYPNWEEKKLGEVLTVSSGRDYKHLESGEIPVYGTGGYMLSVNDFLYDGESVGIGRKGTIDKPVFLTGKFWTVDTLFYTQGFLNVTPYYIYLVFQQINWVKYNEASGVPSLSKKTIELIDIGVPCLEEQEKIASFLSAIDKRIATCQTQIEQTTTWKKGLLQKMFV